ncbi:MAG: branched-chain amino acid transaminase [Helicobacteraceae bacterium]|jgi:branched-chain amino acid aminotransferase|nr:branched-chain amino acid transaminase [Helicobacteraceae bacterium]
MTESQFIWMDGEFIAWNDAKVHILTHSLHYANSAFEGVRAYPTDRGLAIFRLQDHTRRLLNSCKMSLLKCPFDAATLNNAQVEILRKNTYKADTSVYIRPIVFVGYGVMGVYHLNSPIQTAIATWEWGAYLGEEGLNNGIKVKISSFTRNSIKSMMGKAKIAANYLNSQMAKCEAKEAGCDEALLLDSEGFVAEGSGECFFVVRDDVLITPPSENALESITQDTVLAIARDLGIKTERRRLTRDEVYVADEAFFTGTAAELTPVREVDSRVIGGGKRGETTRRLQEAYFDIVYGRNAKYAHYLTYIKG